LSISLRPEIAGKIFFQSIPAKFLENFTANSKKKFLIMKHKEMGMSLTNNLGSEG
jgi:hypothetical protein